MSTTDEDWKEPHRISFRGSLQFFSNEGKFTREKWVVRQLLIAIAVSFEDSDFEPADEPVDVSFHDARFQVKELMKDGRRRHDELRQTLADLEMAESYEDLLETYAPKDITFFDVVEFTIAKAELLETEKYGPSECASMDLLCYFNWLDYSIVPPTDFRAFESSFRSVSVVTNTYCAVLRASPSAPNFLQKCAGRTFSNNAR